VVKRSAPRQHTRHSVAAGVTGLIVTASVMAASGRTNRIRDVAIDVFTAVFVYWIAEAYAEALASNVVGHSGIPRYTQIRPLLVERWPLVQASYAPLVVMLLVRLFGADAATAVLAGLITASVLLAALGWTVHHEASVRARLTSAFVTGCFGVVMIVLKGLLHH
jgi:hypothetical protein